MITPGFTRCADCGKGVLLALAVTGDLIAFDAAFEDGPWEIAWDCTRTPRCRPVGPPGTLRGDEYLYERHSLACPASADLADLAAERLIRRQPGPPRRHASARRAAHAR
jgi:hypothetical protein